jgi:hypothetical protein
MARHFTTAASGSAWWARNRMPSEKNSPAGFSIIQADPPRALGIGTPCPRVSRLDADCADA